MPKRESPSPRSKPPHRSGRVWQWLWEMLAQYNQFPERAPAISAALREAFEQPLAMLVLDMSGFSRLTEKHGVLHYLAMIAQMVETASPAIVANGGRVVKQDADNLFACFASPLNAVEAALDMFRAFEAVNAVTPPHRHIRGSVGIGFGPTLLIDDQDMYGDEMNRACKLGEDLAKPGEILLTQAAADALPAEAFELAPARFQLSEFCFEARKVMRKVLPPRPPPPNP